MRPATNAVRMGLVLLRAGENGGLVDLFDQADSPQRRRLPGPQTRLRREVPPAGREDDGERVAGDLRQGIGDRALADQAGDGARLDLSTIDRVGHAMRVAEPGREATLRQRAILERRDLGGKRLAGMATGAALLVEKRSEPVIGKRRGGRLHPDPVEQRLADRCI